MSRIDRLISVAAPYVPTTLRRMIRSRISLEDYDLARRIKKNPYRDKRQVEFPNSEFTLGIIEDTTQYHQHYIAACLELEVSFKVLSLIDHNWIDLVHESCCDGFLVWPSSFPSTAKHVFDNRLYILERELGANVFPSWKECWLTEHKPRLHDWLLANEIPHPATRVFYKKQQAIEYSALATYPLVVKTATGAAASGVTIVHDESSLRQLIRLAFGRGLRPNSYSPNDRQRGYILIQKYYPNIAREWRMVRMGSAYFGHVKGVGKSGIHSGSKLVEWRKPGTELLDMTREISENGGFESMDIDIFETENGALLVNECQTVFGCSIATTQMMIDGQPCYYRFQEGRWSLVPGDICQNHLCNQRVRILIERLQVDRNNGKRQLKNR